MTVWEATSTASLIWLGFAPDSTLDLGDSTDFRHQARELNCTLIQPLVADVCLPDTMTVLKHSPHNLGPSTASRQRSVKCLATASVVS